MSLFARLFRPAEPPLQPLYRVLVDAARAPVWYREGVPDTKEGRLDLLTSLLALLLLRLEQGGDEGLRHTATLTERFVDDMDGSLRQMGIGDLVVGKNIGRMMEALGGRLGAYREAGDQAERFSAAVHRNLFHHEGGSEAVARRLLAWRDGLAALPLPAVLAGEVPRP